MKLAVLKYYLLLILFFIISLSTNAIASDSKKLSIVYDDLSQFGIIASSIKQRDYDFNNLEAFNMHNFYITRNIRNVHYIQEPFKGHEGLSIAIFEKAVNLHDEVKK